MNDTVFVLGAGASWHYGYPTGEGLIDAVISMAGRLSTYCQFRTQRNTPTLPMPIYVLRKFERNGGTNGHLRAWDEVRRECDLLVHRLGSVRPLVIDYFLGWNPSLQEIGKLLIAAALLECEATYAATRGNPNRREVVMNQPIPPSSEQQRRLDISKFKDDWYRFVVHKLVSRCENSSDLLTNRVKFITFNYDTSLEFHLLRALKSIDFITKNDTEKFILNDRIVHMYGALRKEAFDSNDFVDQASCLQLGYEFTSPQNLPSEIQMRNKFLDRSLLCSEGIRTIDPHDKSDEDRTQCAKVWIRDARLIYVLGYGFDDNNNERVGLLSRDAVEGKSVLFTNFGDINIINRKASKLFVGGYDAFDQQSVKGDPLGSYFEKSTRNVYDALELDFYGFESSLLGSSRV
ncbi:MAG TPA: hypothetical protein VJ476_13180 [Rhizomicrobium sp.]|nr:hypothetical protein [Rhizomicrobium sp.]